jgi:hypothetical protein
MTYPPSPGNAPHDIAPGPQQPFPPYPGPSSHRTNGDRTNPLAIAALVTGLIGCISLVGAVLGVIALRQISRSGEKGKGMAIAGIVLFVVWSVLSIVGVVLSKGSDSGATAKPTPTSTKPKDVNVTKMKVGDCINDGAAADEEVESVKVVPCTQPHDGEVLANFKLRGMILPSEAQVQAQAKAGCHRLSDRRLQRDPAVNALALSWYYPDAQNWRAGDHMVTCVAVNATDGKKLTRRIHP